jgi:hypothetical protein
VKIMPPPAGAKSCQSLVDQQLNHADFAGNFEPVNDVLPLKLTRLDFDCVPRTLILFQPKALQTKFEVMIFWLPWEWRCGRFRSR